MFKKPVRPQVKPTNIKNVKATLTKSISTRDVLNRLHSRSTIDYPDQIKYQQTLPIQNNSIEDISQSNSSMLCSTKSVLKSVSKDRFNQSFNKNKPLSQKQIQMNLPNLKKQLSKKILNENNKSQISSQIDENKLNLTRMKIIDNKQNNQLAEENRKLRIINRHLEEENRALIQALNKYELRQKQLISKIQSSNNCSQHTLIIQSLKRVIDSQLEKIIQLEREIILFNQNKNKQSFHPNHKMHKDQYLSSDRLQEERQFFKDKHKMSFQDYTPNFAPSSPKKLIFDQSNNSTEEDMNLYIEYVDTFRRIKTKEQFNEYEDLPNQETKYKQKYSLTINPDTHSADELLCEIDDCLDSLSRRKRQLL